MVGLDFRSNFLEQALSHRVPNCRPRPRGGLQMNHACRSNEVFITPRPRPDRPKVRAGVKLGRAMFHD